MLKLETDSPSGSVLCFALDGDGTEPSVMAVDLDFDRRKLRTAMEDPVLQDLLNEELAQLYGYLNLVISAQISECPEFADRLRAVGEVSRAVRGQQIEALLHQADYNWRGYASE